MRCAVEAILLSQLILCQLGDSLGTIVVDSRSIPSSTAIFDEERGYSADIESEGDPEIRPSLKRKRIASSRLKVFTGRQKRDNRVLDEDSSPHFAEAAYQHPADIATTQSDLGALPEVVQQTSDVQTTHEQPSNDKHEINQQYDSESAFDWIRRVFPNMPVDSGEVPIASQNTAESPSSDDS